MQWVWEWERNCLVSRLPEMREAEGKPKEGGSNAITSLFPCPSGQDVSKECICYILHPSSRLSFFSSAGVKSSCIFVALPAPQL